MPGTKVKNYLLIVKGVNLIKARDVAGEKENRGNHGHLFTLGEEETSMVE
jgi:hypothetical protein